MNSDFVIINCTYVFKLFSPIHAKHIMCSGKWWEIDEIKKELKSITKSRKVKRFSFVYVCSVSIVTRTSEWRRQWNSQYIWLFPSVMDISLCDREPRPLRTEKSAQSQFSTLWIIKSREILDTVIDQQILHIVVKPTNLNNQGKGHHCCRQNNFIEATLWFLSQSQFGR